MLKWGVGRCGEGGRDRLETVIVTSLRGNTSIFSDLRTQALWKEPYPSEKAAFSAKRKTKHHQNHVVLLTFPESRRRHKEPMNPVLSFKSVPYLSVYYCLFMSRIYRVWSQNPGTHTPPTNLRVFQFVLGRRQVGWCFFPQYVYITHIDKNQNSMGHVQSSRYLGHSFFF